MLEKQLAGRKQAHAPRRTREKRSPELVLEALELTTERWLRDVQAVRRATYPALFCHGNKIADLRQAHGAIVTHEPRARGTRATIPKRYWTRSARTHLMLAMAVVILDACEQAAMRRAGRAAVETLALVAQSLRVGMTTAEIDALVRRDTAARGGAPSQLGFHGFPAAVCTSRNAVVCHGIPNAEEALEPGDIVNVDVTTCLDGFHGDTSATFFVGPPSPDARHVVDVARRCRDAGIAVVREGARLGDIGAAIAELARAEGCSVVRELGGHGIGRQMHCAPHIPHYGRQGTGLRLRAGMAFTIEPMINLGQPDVVFLDDGWTVVTADGSLSAQFEHTLLVTRDGCEVLTA
jgi:methionyl aminopeptidase